MGRVAPAGRPPSTIVPTSPDRKEEDQKKTTGCVWPPYQTTRPPSSEVVAVVRRCARRSFICRIEIVVIDGGLVAGRLAVAADRSRRQSAQSRRQRTDHLGKRRGLLLPAPPFPRRWLSFVRYLSPALYTAMHACTHAEAQRPARGGGSACSRTTGTPGRPAARCTATAQREEGLDRSGGLGFAARESEGCQSRQTPISSSPPAMCCSCGRVWDCKKGADPRLVTDGRIMDLSIVPSRAWIACTGGIDEATHAGQRHLQSCSCLWQPGRVSELTFLRSELDRSWSVRASERASELAVETSVWLGESESSEAIILSRDAVKMRNGGRKNSHYCHLCG
jgi:hypothetical protein